MDSGSAEDHLKPDSDIAGARLPFLDTDDHRRRRGGTQWVLLALALTGLGIAGFLLSNVVPFGRHTASVSVLSEAQREAAQGFWDTVVDQYVKLGLIIRYQTERDTFVMYVRGSQWKLLSAKDKKTFLANVSTSNEILGRPTLVEIRDQETGQVYAATNPRRVEQIHE
jgi:hypothetical protein